MRCGEVVCSMYVFGRSWRFSKQQPCRGDRNDCRGEGCGGSRDCRLDHNTPHSTWNGNSRVDDDGLSVGGASLRPDIDRRITGVGKGQAIWQTVTPQEAAGAMSVIQHSTVPYHNTASSSTTAADVCNSTVPQPHLSLKIRTHGRAIGLCAHDINSAW